MSVRTPQALQPPANTTSFFDESPASSSTTRTAAAAVNVFDGVMGPDENPFVRLEDGTVVTVEDQTKLTCGGVFAKLCMFLPLFATGAAFIVELIKHTQEVTIHI